MLIQYKIYHTKNLYTLQSNLLIERNQSNGFVSSPLFVSFFRKVSIFKERDLISFRVAYCLIYLFVVPATRIFFVKSSFLFFFNEAVNLCLFLAHVERVFRGAPYFVATSLFENPFLDASNLSTIQSKIYLSVFVSWAPSFSRKHLTKN